MGVLELLTVVFIILKVTNYGEFGSWSWWAVFAPIWVGYLAALVIWIFVLILGAVFGRR